jgi:hypothetical protein
MITGLAIENFKGIRERVKLGFRPITLFFGPNSAGKSTILHALHYAREIFERHNLDADQTIAGGKYIDLGGFKRLLHRDDDGPTPIARSTITLRIDVDVSRNDLKSFYPDIDRLIAQTVADIDRYRDDIRANFEDIRELLDYEFHSLFNDIKTAAVELVIGWSNPLDRPFVTTNTIYFDDAPFMQLVANPALRGVEARFSFREPEPQNPDHMIDVSTLTHRSLKRVSDLPRTERQQELANDDMSLLEILLSRCGEMLSFRGPNQIDLDSLVDALPPLDDALDFSPSMISPTGDPEHDTRHAFEINLATELVRALSQYVVGPCQLVRDQLQHFRYLGPLRETPPRNYAPPRFADPARWASGLGAWDTLYAGSDELIEAVGNWLGDEDKLDSGCSLERRTSVTFDYGHPLIRKLIAGRTFDDLEHDWSLDVSQAQSASRVVVVANSGVELHPHEVGIGISQVVPVIVTALDDGERMLAIEQPELHIHPRLQAEIADLFVEAIAKNKHRFIIETHSEHLILRLLRRIRETEVGKAPAERQLRTDDLAIYYLKHENGTTRERSIDVDVNGQFIQPWPDDFFEIDFFERFPDAR